MLKQRLGTFTKGHTKLGGRKKGTRNRFNRDLIDAIVQAADQVGADGKGKKGVDGYLQMLAGKKAGYFVALLRQAVQKQGPVVEQPENGVIYGSEEEFRQALLDRGVQPSLLPPPRTRPARTAAGGFQSAAAAARMGVGIAPKRPNSGPRSG